MHPSVDPTSRSMRMHEPIDAPTNQHMTYVCVYNKSDAYGKSIILFDPVASKPSSVTNI